MYFLKIANVDDKLFMLKTAEFYKSAVQIAIDNKKNKFLEEIIV
jgi:hypothetical protein